jgi:hypothetical protein
MIYELAGVVGIDPGPLTLRELFWMVDGRRRDAWDRTAAQIAALFNAAPDPTGKRKPRQPSEFHPFYARAKPKKKIVVPIQALKVFLRNR